jgi:hypothetical protein
MYRLIFLLPLILLLTTMQLHSHVIHVPGDSTTIQGGIDGAVDGDTVMVADGTYTGNGNRDIDFTGKAIVVMSENGPEVAIIDCGGISYRGFLFQSGEDISSVLSGFTITNGWDDGEGGGIYNYYSSPMIANCIFAFNYAPFGAGMNNYYSNPTVIDCTFDMNNSVGNGGGMYNDHSSPTVARCTFTGNIWMGMTNSYSSPTVTNCTFRNNGGYRGTGGMTNWYYSSPTITNCIFIENSFGGMENSVDSNPIIVNCTFSGNPAFFAGGGITNYNSNPTITNCILWGDTGGEIYNDNSNPVVTYCDVEGGYPGTGNIDVDPQFVTFHGYDYLLNRGSPCIDAGDPSIEDGIIGPGWYMNGSRSDMGTYGGPRNNGWLP